MRLEQNRDPWMMESVAKLHAIGFYPREFYCLDNFSSFKVEYNGYVYATAEEAYQSAKFEGFAADVADAIKNSFSAHEAQKIAQNNKDRQRPDWDEVKLSVMEDILRAKIQQNPYVLKKLIETRKYTIVEDSPKDSYWGWGSDCQGKNMLGKIWMKLRSELVEELRE